MPQNQRASPGPNGPQSPRPLAGNVNSPAGASQQGESQSPSGDTPMTMDNPNPAIAQLEVDDENEDTVSIYTMDAYPNMTAAYQVERPYHPGSGSAQDDATIDSARTLYAEDVDYITEHDRTYCGDYFMPVDQTEQTRQYVAHQVYLKLFNLELTTVPLENPRYILDIGTGIGEWAIGMAEKYPQCEVFGTDIAPIQPTHQVPFNVEFHIENAEDEWIRPPDTVDLVHFRNMEGAFSDWRYIYQQAYNCLKPGGWIEVIDYDDYFTSENFLSFYPPESPAHLLAEGVLEAARLAGRPRGIDHMSKALLEEIGYVDINETVYDMGVGSRENSSYGSFWLFSVVTGLEAGCLRSLTKDLGWDPKLVRDMCKRAAQDTRAIAEDTTRTGSFVIKLRVVTARKPTAQEQWLAGKGTVPESETGTLRDGDQSTIRSVKTVKTAISDVTGQETRPVSQRSNLTEA
ncbi:S-adenosyl-L-methionine-dependent methyltransferase [Pseudoneurospora amorphoporcata]|uniref:S-adenosyl-L-methionine-dependent methyltransferase n=1 Tax=Pseudoneurospora amorphoporcata TaxID=241081 RepID=A0AAN6NZF9_9PEZI|nr:S-adenosyl-L-methionine-dependent methyltransferase [Pseudoneurospora amorphoporcata]